VHYDLSRVHKVEDNAREPQIQETSSPYTVMERSSMNPTKLVYASVFAFCFLTIAGIVQGVLGETGLVGDLYVLAATILGALTGLGVERYAS